jgi:predicted small lipoprotein YifL
MRTVTLALAISIGVSACGQKGALYLPDDPPAGYRTPTDSYKPVPYPESPDRDAASRQ